MANNLRVFNTNSEYQSADLVHPAVSYVVDTNKVIYDMATPPFQGKWKATYQDSHVETAECGSSSAIVNGEINRTNLVGVEIGNCVTSIGDRAFFATNLTSIEIPSGVTSIGEGAFLNCTGLTSINIPSGVTNIANSTFANCKGLAGVNIPSGVTSIGRNAFSSCSGLTSIDIPDSVTSIDIAAFYDCRSLTSIEIPSGVTSIGSIAFEGCSGLTSVTVKAIIPPTINQEYGGIFKATTCPIYVPTQSVETYKSATGWSDYADRIQAIS